MIKLRCGKTFRTPLGVQEVCSMWDKHPPPCRPDPVREQFRLKEKKK